MTTIALAGLAHPAASALALALEDHPGVERILGVVGTSQEPPLLGPKLELVPPHGARFDDGLREAEALAFFPILNLAGRAPDAGGAATLDLLGRALAAAGTARTVVLWSGGVVYGAHPDNPIPITEAHPPRPHPGFAPGKVLAQAERLVLARGGPPQRTAVVLRPAAIWDPTWRPFLARRLQGPALLAVRGHEGPVQALHPDDAVSALLLALEGQLTGVYNVAPDDWLPLPAAASAAGRRLVPLPEGLVTAAAEQLAAFGLPLLAPGELPYHLYPWVLANERLRAAGWTPTRTSAEAFAAAGQRTPERAFPRRANLAAGTAAGLAALALAALARRRRR